MRKQQDTKDHTIILQKNMEEVMHQSMLPYSEHVILERALPRVEDGLKPVQRRVLYVMYEQGLTPDKAFRKSANIVGETMAKYHPHGDSSIYETMVRLAQDFNMRTPLVEGNGNFGSMDGDPPAAFRYTEARMAPAALELMRDLEKDTVSWSLNFDDTRREPDVLPALFPNLLINGASGIAVGLATNIPPHNPGEVIDAVIAYLQNPRISLDKVMEIIKGPDFPTGGIIANGEALRQIYTTGVGKLTMRARAKVESIPGGKSAIVITEFPYQTNKAELLAKILETARAQKEIIAQIADIRDESDRTGVRAVIEVKREGDAGKLLNFFYKYTDLQKTFGVNMVAIAEGKPKQMSLLDAIRYYADFRREVEVRRARFELKAAREREEILAGLLIAAKNIDKVIKIIRTSKTPAQARERLCETFRLTERQATAILEMRLRRITALEVENIESELAEIRELIAELESILADKKKLLAVIRASLLDVKKRLKSPRRTEILQNSKLADVARDAFKTVEDAVIYADENGELHQVSEKIFENISKEMPVPAEHVAKLRTDMQVLLIGDCGGCYVVDAEDVPENKTARERGVIPERIVKGFTDHRVIFLCPVDPKLEKQKLLMITRCGMGKTTQLSEYFVARRKFDAMTLSDEDRLVYAGLRTRGTAVICTLSDGSEKTLEKNLPLIARKTKGVKALKLKPGVTCASVRQA